MDLVRENINTLEKVLTHASKLHSDKKCLGTRQILSEEDEVQKNDKVFKKYNMGEYQWHTFSGVNKKADEFGRGLRELGLEPSQNIAIFAETRAEWMIAAHGCFKQNFPIVTIYATLGDDGVVHGMHRQREIRFTLNLYLIIFSYLLAINETEASIVITSHELLPKFKKLLAHLPHVKSIVYMEDQLVDTETDGFEEGINILSYNEVVSKGENSAAVASPPTPDDIAIIMYTSGSTGTPKGVLLSHKNCITTLKGFSDAVDVTPNDIVIAYVFSLEKTTFYLIITAR